MRNNKIQKRQEKILLEALKLFTDKGYFNTSVSDIQAACNCSVGTLYNYFDSKEAIAVTLFSNIENCLYEALCYIEKKYDSTYDGCKAVIRHLFETTERNAGGMQYLLYTKHREFMPVEKSVFSSLPFLKMKDMVIKGQNNGSIRAIDPDVAVVAIFGAPIRMIHLRIDGVLEKKLPTYLDECWECSWRSVKA
ncbi:MAG: TetR/AcrR family transcriptional regulator [Desulforhopalus sp.]